MGPRIDIRLPLPIRIYIGGFGVAWCGGLLAAVVQTARQGRPDVFIGLLMLAVGAIFSVRVLRMQVATRDGELLVRNWYRTRRLERAEIEDFRMGSSVLSLPFGKTLYVLLRDGTIFPLDVTARFYLGRRGRAKLDARLEQLRAWLRGSM